MTETTLEPSPFRRLLFGVDTVYLSFDPEVSRETYDRLLTEQAEARAARDDRNAAYCSAWLDAQVYPHGANGFGILIEKADHFSVKVQVGNTHRPGIYLELRSIALHTHPEGPYGACEQAVAWLRDTLFADRDAYDQAKIVLGQEKLSRIDLHLDYQCGWHPTLDEGEHRLFIKPARATWAPHCSGDDCTGYTVGKKRIMARIYNKSIEARHRHNDQYFALLAAVAGEAFNPDEDVWRIEFELKREGVNGFCLTGSQEDQDDDAAIFAEMEGEDLPTIGTLKKALHWSPTLWTYLTSHWLRLVQPTDDPNRSRWPIHPVWQQIQAGFDAPHSSPLPDDLGQLVRAQRHSGKRRLIQRMAAGLATTATLMLDTDPTQALGHFLANVERMAAQLADYQAEKRALGRQKLDDVRYEQYLQHLAHLAQMAGGTLAIAGVLQQDAPTAVDMPDLLDALAGQLDEVAQDKGGVQQMLYDKWCSEYKVLPPRQLFKRPVAMERGDTYATN